MEFSKLLTEEHKPIRRALSVLESMRDKIQQGDTIDVHDVNALLLFLHCFADGCHQGKEESILFPVLQQAVRDQQRRRTSFSIGDIECLVEEHKEERKLFEKTQIALFADERSDFVEHARTLIDRVTEHMVKEERFLFPSAEQILTEHEAIEVAMRLQEANAKFGECQLTLLTDVLKQLEEKFIPKAA